MIKYFFKLFFQIIIPFLLIFAIYSAFSYEKAVDNAEKSYKEILKTYWLLVSRYNMDDKNEVASIFKSIDNKSDIRISVIDKKGNVILDSSVNENNIKFIENHLSRVEVQNALLGKEYYDIRKSATTGRYCIYYASMYNDKYVLRIVSDGIIFHNLYSKLKSDIILFFIIYAVLSAVISIYVAFRLTMPALELSKVAKAISENKSDFIMPKISDKIMNDAATLIYNINRLLLQEKQALNREQSILSNIINYIDEAVILFSSDNKILKANYQAYKFFNTIKEGINPLVDNADYESAVFFCDILEKKGSLKHIYKEQVYEVYVKEMDEYKLAVFRDITNIADYDDFKAVLTANIAHEMKTPVAIIMAASETLLNDKDMEKEFAEKFLNKINTGSKRLNNIINQTLELYKMENTGLNIEENANIKNILSNIMVKENGKKIIYENMAEKEYNIDNLHVEMILTNLINNAEKYSKGENIYVKIYDENSALVIEVSDEGPLILEKERKRIFERFYTVSKSRNNSGFGLGLSIVKHIALLYGGKASVYTNEYNGNTFKVVLYEKI